MGLDNISIVGMGAVTTLGAGVERLWKALVAGECAIKPKGYGDFPIGRLFHNGKDASTHDIASVAIHEAIHQSGKAHGRRALVLATTKGDLKPWLHWRMATEVTPAPSPMLSDLATSLAARFGCHSRVLAVSAACASGSQAVIEAAEMLQDGDADEVIVVGVDVLSDFIVYGFGALQALSKQPARPFDASRDGLNLGEAGAAVVLRRAKDAGKPLAMLTGWGSSNDANHISGPSRDGYGLSLAIGRALAHADRKQLRALCAHGTATRYNDAMEAHAFYKALGPTPPPVFGIKGSIGHTLGAAALIEVNVSALAVRERKLPPTVGFKSQDPYEPALDVVASPREIANGAILSTNSGFGGINTALLIGGAP